MKILIFISIICLCFIFNNLADGIYAIAYELSELNRKIKK